MFNPEITEKVLEKNKLPHDVSTKYLNLYVGHSDTWLDAITRLYGLLKSRNKELPEEQLLEKIKQGISFAILFPAHDRSLKIDKDNPENHLFWSQSFSQLEGKDWFAEFQKVFRQDTNITEYRKEVLKLGVIDAVEFHPLSRQAYRWLCESAESSEVELTPELKKKFYNLVMAYGGAIITYMYEKHSKEIDKKVINWRSAYFFERLMYQVYQPEQVIKIKQNDINNTNPQWVKTVK